MRTTTGASDDGESAGVLATMRAPRPVSGGAKMSGLEGARVALLQGRRSDELADLVRRHGGVPVSVAAVREAAVDARADVASFIDRLTAGEFAIVIFLTGAGVNTLFDEARRLGREDELMRALGAAMLVTRGPKPAAALKPAGLVSALRVHEPFTTAELLAAMDQIPLAGIPVALVHYGERNDALAGALIGRGARLAELCLYEWLLPEDLAPIQAMVRALIAGELDAIAFTSQVQARNLFMVAADLGLADALRRALNERVVVASVGPTCATALAELGVPPDIVPEHPKMGHLIVALARDFAAHRTMDGALNLT